MHGFNLFESNGNEFLFEGPGHLNCWIVIKRLANGKIIRSGPFSKEDAEHEAARQHCSIIEPWQPE